MGKKARAIVELSLKELVKDLNKAYCDEWLAFYLYSYMAQIVSGKNCRMISELLQGIAQEELEHARMLADLIIKLGDVPTATPMDLEKNANSSYTLPPKNRTDTNRMIRIVSEAEADAIEVYHRLAKRTAGKDFNSHRLILHILSEEIDHEERLENLMER